MKPEVNKTKNDGFKKKLAIIGGGRMASIFSLNAHDMDIETHCFSLENGIVSKNDFDYIHCVNIFELDRVLDICDELNIDGVVATTELTIPVAAYISEQLGLVGISYDVSKKITNKLRNRKITQNIKDLDQPQFKIIYSEEELKNTQINFPAILKPTSKGGKRGVIVLQDRDNLSKDFKYAIEESNGELPLILEEFIEGDIECSIESLTYNGNHYIIQITEKVTSGPPHCVELAHHQPANISAEVRTKLERVIKDSLSAIGLTNGPCHTEVKIKNENIYLIEFNARPGGDHIAYPLTELSTGYNYIKGAIEIALGEFDGVEFDKFKNNYSGVIFIVEQTKEFLDIFNNCQDEDWLFLKHQASDDLKKIIHNDGFGYNYFIYNYYKKPDFEKKKYLDL